MLVRRLAKDLDIDVEIFGCPTVREPDGLAMSSRSARLTVSERQIAPVLASTLTAASQAII